MNSYTDFAEKLSAAIIERSAENEEKKTEFMKTLSKKEDPISGFVNAFKSFLGR